MKGVDVNDLFIRRERCGYFVGTVASSEKFRRLPTKSHGLYDLLTADDECPARARKSRVEPADGKTSADGKASAIRDDASMYDDASSDGLTLGRGYCDLIRRFNGKAYARTVSAPTIRVPDGIRP